MLEALEVGTSFCFLHYDEKVPSRDGFTGMPSKTDVDVCFYQQIGFRWLINRDVSLVRNDFAILRSEVVRNEFNLYNGRWGSTKNAFYFPTADESFEKILTTVDNYWTGFSIKRKRAFVIYLPCLRDFQLPKLIEECLTDLINGVITYLTRSRVEVPDWATNSLFTEENTLHSELLGLRSKVEHVESLLESYRNAKALSFLSEYEFEHAVPKFIKSHLDIPTFRHEQYKEDFWITDEQGQKIIIAETKTYARGFKKGAIHSLISHRESQDLDDDFPALLVINAHMNANSWQEKLRSIDPQDYKLAAKNNVLLLRAEDLLFLWNSIIEKQRTKDDILALLLKEHGWLQVQPDGNTKVHE